MNSRFAMKETEMIVNGCVASLLMRLLAFAGITFRENDVCRSLLNSRNAAPLRLSKAEIFLASRT